MKITKSQLRQIIKEELEKTMAPPPSDYHKLMEAKRKAFIEAGEDCQKMKNYWPQEAEDALRAADEAMGGKLVGRRHAEPCRDYGLGE